MTIEEIKELYKMIADRDDTIAVLYARIAELEAFQETWLCRRDKTGEANCQLETGSDLGDSITKSSFFRPTKSSGGTERSVVIDWSDLLS